MSQDSRKLIEELNKSSKKKRKEIVLTPKGLVSGESNKKKQTKTGIVVGFVTGIPLGAFIELWRFLRGMEWDNGFIGIIIIVVTVIIATVAGYFYGAYMDGGT